MPSPSCEHAGGAKEHDPSEPGAFERLLHQLVDLLQSTETDGQNKGITMRKEAFLAAMLILAPITTMAQPEPGEKAAPPRFNSAETRMIDRNELLHAIVAQDPWLVRQILDLVARRAPKGGSAPDLHSIDLAKNPDIAPAARAAAGSVELIELLRRARSEKEAGQSAGTPEGTERSAVGSVETLDMLRRTRDAKGGRK
jgi:hypothetical protein